MGAEALLLSCFGEGSFLWVSFYPASFFGAPSMSFENYRPLLCLQLSRVPHAHSSLYLALISQDF